MRVGNTGVTSSSIRAPHHLTENHREGKSRLASLLVLAVHVLCGLRHRGDRLVQIDPMPAGYLIGGDYISRPCLDRAECTSLDARDLHKSSHRIAGHSQVMLQCGLCGVLDYE